MSHPLGIAGALRHRTAARRLLERALGIGLAVAASAIGTANAEARQPSMSTDATVVLQRVSFGDEVASTEAREVADWIAETNDNGTLPFVIVDKRQARVFVFDAHRQLRGSSPALLGLTVGDEVALHVGERPLSRIGPAERTTQAGRFDATLGNDLQGEQVLWVDYDSGLALHRLISGRPKDQRKQRLAAAAPLEHRITFGCINVSAALFDAVVVPLFTPADGVVYVLPETRPARAFFAARGVGARAGG